MSRWCPTTWLAGIVGAWAIAAPAGAAEVVKYYHADALGTVRAVTDRAGVVLERFEYYPFGEDVAAAATPTHRRFTGKERDDESGLDYFGARHYLAKTARFTSVDPVYTWRENLVDPQRWNRYAYVRNNPLRYTDPDGREIRGDAGLVAYIQALARQSSSVARTLSLYEGKGAPDLILEVGSIQQTAEGDTLGRATGAFDDHVPLPEGGSTKRMIAQNGGLAHDVALLSTTIRIGTEPNADSRRREVVLHELGHADRWARNPLESYITDRDEKAKDPSTGKPRVEYWYQADEVNARGYATSAAGELGREP